MSYQVGESSDLYDPVTGAWVGVIDAKGKEQIITLPGGGGAIGDAIAEHEAAEDPHPQYLTQEEADILYATTVVQNPTGTFLVSGGGVAWLGGMNYRGTASTYVIQGVRYTAPQADMTLSAADGDDPRIDAFVLNTSGAWAVVEGTPDANPEKADIDPATQLDVSFAIVPAGATAPLVDVVHDIYRENTEWTTSRNGTTFTLAGAVAPISGSVSIAGALVATGHYWQATHPSTVIDLAITDGLCLTIKNDVAWAATRSVNLGFYNANTQRGALVTLRHGLFGFDAADITSEQQIVIPTTLFGANGMAVNRLRMTAAGTGTNLSFKVDDVYLQAGVSTAPPVVSDRMRNRGVWNSGALYDTHDVTRHTISGKTSLFVSLVPNVNSTPSLSSTVWALLVDLSDVAFVERVNAFSAQQYSEVVDLGLTLSGAVEIDAEAGNVFEGTQTGNITELSVANGIGGMTFSARFTIGGAGGFTVAYAADIHFPAGVPEWPTTAGDVIVITGQRHDSNSTWECSAVAPGTVVGALADLSDVDTTGASEGDVLTLVGGVWVPQAPAAGGDSMTIALVTATFTRPGDTTQYAAGDVMTASAPVPLSFANAGSANGKGGIILSATLVDSLAQGTKPDIDLHLFDTTLTVEADNAAWDPSDAERLREIGVIEFRGGDFKVGANNGTIQGFPLGLPYKCLAGDTTIYGVAVARNAYTPGNAEVFTVNLILSQEA